MRVSVTGAWGGGGICADVRNILHHGGLNIAPLRVRVLCHALMDWKGAGQISSSGDTAAGGVNTALEQGKDVYIPSLGRGNGKSGTAGDINLHHLSPKHCRTLYCNKANHGPMSGGRAASGVAVFKAVLGAGKP